MTSRARPSYRYLLEEELGSITTPQQVKEPPTERESAPRSWPGAYAGTTPQCGPTRRQASSTCLRRAGVLRDRVDVYSLEGGIGCEFVHEDDDVRPVCAGARHDECVVL